MPFFGGIKNCLPWARCLSFLQPGECGTRKRQLSSWNQTLNGLPVAGKDGQQIYADFHAMPILKARGIH
ncbi:hypothetical protein DPMN_143623 [Dreissena polymorpha]|uniref:Uncharacterized protein n=1 Tax=Dreissena polymorpha TaxID=45954 RepID=A0A9D4GJH4_DREPO|nr:hypothetical protein DPMN_143623 [Dreissena polymorpha]